MIQMYEKCQNDTMEKIKLSASQLPKKSKEWKVLDRCMAPYSDGKYYPAQILSINEDSCRINYTEYDEEGDVKLAELLRYVLNFILMSLGTD